MNEVTKEEAGRWEQGKHVDGKHATTARVGGRAGGVRSCAREGSILPPLALQCKVPQPGEVYCDISVGGR